MHYHHRKKIHISLVFLLMISLLFFISFFKPVKKTWIGGLRNNLANVVGVSAAVPENRYNILAQQLEQEKLKIQEKENKILEKEKALKDEYYRKNEIFQKKVAVYGFFISLVLLILVIVNFYYDIRRNKSKVNIIKLQR